MQMRLPYSQVSVPVEEIFKIPQTHYLTFSHDLRPSAKFLFDIGLSLVNDQYTSSRRRQSNDEDPLYELSDSSEDSFEIRGDVETSKSTETSEKPNPAPVTEKPGPAPVTKKQSPVPVATGNDFDCEMKQFVMKNCVSRLRWRELKYRCPTCSFRADTFIGLHQHMESGHTIVRKTRGTRVACVFKHDRRFATDKYGIFRAHMLEEHQIDVSMISFCLAIPPQLYDCATCFFSTENPYKLSIHNIICYRDTGPILGPSFSDQNWLLYLENKRETIYHAALKKKPVINPMRHPITVTVSPQSKQKEVRNAYVAKIPTRQVPVTSIQSNQKNVPGVTPLMSMQLNSDNVESTTTWVAPLVSALSDSDSVESTSSGVPPLVSAQSNSDSFAGPSTRVPPRVSRLLISDSVAGPSTGVPPRVSRQLISDSVAGPSTGLPPLVSRQPTLASVAGPSTRLPPLVSMPPNLASAAGPSTGLPPLMSMQPNLASAAGPSTRLPPLVSMQPNLGTAKRTSTGLLPLVPMQPNQNNLRTNSANASTLPTMTNRPRKVLYVPCAPNPSGIIRQSISPSAENLATTPAAGYKTIMIQHSSEQPSSTRAAPSLVSVEEVGLMRLKNTSNAAQNSYIQTRRKQDLKRLIFDREGFHISPIQKMKRPIKAVAFKRKGRQKQSKVTLSRHRKLQKPLPRDTGKDNGDHSYNAKIPSARPRQTRSMTGSLQKVRQRRRPRECHKLYLCEFCNASLRDFTALSIHLMEIHNIKVSTTTPELYCRHCGKTFWTASGFRGHMASDTRCPLGIQCPMCFKPFLKEAIYLHVSWFHANEFEEWLNQGYCLLCNNSKEQYLELENHWAEAHNLLLIEWKNHGGVLLRLLVDAYKEKEASSDTDPTLSAHSCPVCDYICSNRLALRDHFILSEHRMKCSIETCNSSFMDRYELMAHLTVDHWDTMRRCRWCPDFYAETAVQLNRHFFEFHTPRVPNLVIKRLSPSSIMKWSYGASVSHNPSRRSYEARLALLNKPTNKISKHPQRSSNSVGDPYDFFTTLDGCQSYEDLKTKLQFIERLEESRGYETDDGDSISVGADDTVDLDVEDYFEDGNIDDEDFQLEIDETSDDD